MAPARTAEAAAREKVRTCIFLAREAVATGTVAVENASLEWHEGVEQMLRDIHDAIGAWLQTMTEERRTSEQGLKWNRLAQLLLQGAFYSHFSIRRVVAVRFAVLKAFTTSTARM